MTLVLLRKTPRDGMDWERFHFSHYLDHKIILGVVASKLGIPLYMPPIWPVPGNNYTPELSEWHQNLHDQMNAISGTQTSDMTEADLSTYAKAQAFIEPNYRDHYAFHQLVGIPL